MMQTDVLIVGGGFAGVYSAWRLARDGARVTLVEASDHLGGTMWSWTWNGYLVDPGTHTFDLRSPIGAAFYEDILHDNLKETDRHDFASTTGRHVSHGFEMPDFSTDDPALCRAALKELAALETAPARPQPVNYTGWLRATYGDALGGRLAAMLEKIVGGPGEDLALEARGGLGMLSRPKLGTDAEMIALKERSAYFDERLGVTLNSGDPRFAGRSVAKRFGYPARGALRQFCIQAAERLAALGVVVLTETKVIAIEPRAHDVRVTMDGAAGGDLHAERLFWTLPDHGLTALLGIDCDWKAVVRPVGGAFIAFEVPVDAIAAAVDYLHDFSAQRRCYRYNRAGVYSGQISPKGMTYVTAEVPAHPAKLSAMMNEELVQAVWDDLLDVGFLKANTPRGAHGQWGYPVAYTLPRQGWTGPISAVREALAARSPRLSTIEFGRRGRHSFMTFYEDTLQHELRA